ncbi:unnamed protein product [Linum trigynum]|uniref:Uncharacterized protein n=1 Tax=Linum trigynum TaxID=586398 RepID=A0AAV2CW02_9ROSI
MIYLPPLDGDLDDKRVSRAQCNHGINAGGGHLHCMAHSNRMLLEGPVLLAWAPYLSPPNQGLINIVHNTVDIRTEPSLRHRRNTCATDHVIL